MCAHAYQMQLSRHLCRSCCSMINVSDHDGVSRGESVHDRRHQRPMSHAPHDDSYGPQLYIRSGEVAAWWTIPTMAVIKKQIDYLVS